MSLVDHKKLDVWIKAMDLAVAVYAAARQMPKQEEYRLTAQMIRAAISVPANIAEGHTRATRKEYMTSSLIGAADEINRMLNRLHSRLKEPT